MLITDPSIPMTGKKTKIQSNLKPHQPKTESWAAGFSSPDYPDAAKGERTGLQRNRAATIWLITETVLNSTFANQTFYLLLYFFNIYKHAFIFTHVSELALDTLLCSSCNKTIPKTLSYIKSLAKGLKSERSYL